MKKFLTALVTFIVGIFGFNLLTIKFSQDPKLVAPAKVKFEIPTARTEDNSSVKIARKTESIKPFFDSFGSKDYYGGWFIADDFKGMPEVWTILLRRGGENSKGEKIVWSAMILTQHPDYMPNDDDNFHSVQIRTEGNRLSFGTNKIRGIEYKFEGEFIKDGKSFEQEEKVLRGTLQKIIKGKRVARFTTDFGYFEPRCFH